MEKFNFGKVCPPDMKMILIFLTSNILSPKRLPRGLL